MNPECIHQWDVLDKNTGTSEADKTVIRNYIFFCKLCLAMNLRTLKFGTEGLPIPPEVKEKEP